MLWYVIQIEDDVEPFLHGPYKSEERCDKVARRLKELSGGEDGIFYLDVRNMRDMEIGAYSREYISGYVENE